jgi:hypothetical protein
MLPVSYIRFNIPWPLVKHIEELSGNDHCGNGLKSLCRTRSAQSMLHNNYILKERKKGKKDFYRIYYLQGKCATIVIEHELTHFVLRQQLA